MAGNQEMVAHQNQSKSNVDHMSSLVSTINNTPISMVRRTFPPGNVQDPGPLVQGLSAVRFHEPRRKHVVPHHLASVQA
jgi:hypothetical protein